MSFSSLSASALLGKDPCPKPTWPARSWDATMVYRNFSRNFEVSAWSMCDATADYITGKVRSWRGRGTQRSGHSYRVLVL